MSSITDLSCPLCHAQARCGHHPARRLKHIICPNCTEYVIKAKAEAWLADRSVQAREQYATQASRGPEGMVLFISRSPVSESPENPSVRGEWLPLEQALHR